ncbi:serine hydrolase domain-containing protein [Amycolatopsis thermophila]|uniref:D-alanyl-D-alanine carboxypeptidase n=1 Tax=Amycolatopsis thermophila TaxID=206084 RepID=A0ABU0F5K9_9PSEU|nr:serine hydrolase domain-containing protein [Amycolatopsis thermophila]MDQ0382431.1 D-alanyl-D-alanine carboxypeptidase [Amycolatopsis thermophila]
MSLRRRTVLKVGALGTAGWSAVAGRAVAGESPPVHSALLTAMRDLAGKPGGPPALTVAIGRDGGSAFHSVGVSDVVSGRAPRPDDHMRVASVAKAFSAATALSVVSRGELGLDDTVGHRLDGFPRQWSPVTLRQLLGHTSGIPDFSKSGRFRDALLASLQDPPPPRALLGYLDDPDLQFPPGTRYSYSNSDNILVGLMCEAATGIRYEDLMRRLVAGPLNLTRTSLPRGSALPDPYLHGYDGADDVSTQVAAGWSWASGGVVSTPADLVRFIRAHAAGTLLHPAVRAAQFRFRPGGSEPPGPGVNAAGLGIFRYDTRYGRVYGHTGNTAGYTQFAAATRDGRRAVAVSATAQITPGTNAALFEQLRAIYELAVGAALAR